MRTVRLTLLHSICCSDSRELFSVLAISSRVDGTDCQYLPSAGLVTSILLEPGGELDSVSEPLAIISSGKNRIYINFTS